MRAIKTRSFYIKNKVMPFAQLPELVHEYFEEQGLTSYRFLYHLSELLNESYRPDPSAASERSGICHGLGKCAE